MKLYDFLVTQKSFTFTDVNSGNVVSKSASIIFQPIKNTWRHVVIGGQWVLSAEVDGKMETLAAQKKDFLLDTMNPLLEIPTILERRVLWKLCTGASEDHAMPLTPLKVVVGFQHLNLFLLNTFISMNAPDMKFYKISQSFGLNHVNAIEYEPIEGRAQLTLYLDQSASEDEKLLLSLFLKRLPGLRAYMTEDLGRPVDANWAVRPALNDPPYPITLDLFTTPAMYFRTNLFDSDISRSHIVYEVPDRAPVRGNASSVAFSWTAKYDALYKAYIAYSTYYIFLMTPCAAQDWIYRIVIRSNEKEGTMNFLWVLKDCNLSTQLQTQLMSSFLSFFKAIFIDVPGKLSILKVDPFALNLKALISSKEVDHEPDLTHIPDVTQEVAAFLPSTCQNDLNSPATRNSTPVVPAISKCPLSGKNFLQYFPSHESGFVLLGAFDVIEYIYPF